MSFAARYRTIAWRMTIPDDMDDAHRRIEAALADGWELHGGPIALPGERVLQALVRPVAKGSLLEWRRQVFDEGYARGQRDAKAEAEAADDEGRS